MKPNTWYQGKAVQGKKLGRLLGYPTINLDNPQVLSKEKEGVYVVKVRINNKQYYGLLFFGPRLILAETKKIIEIFLFEFNQQIYGNTIKYRLISYLRKPVRFSTTAAFQNQIKKDIKMAKESLKTPRG